MRTIGNVLWLIFVGLWTALEWVVAGAILCITVVGIPFGIQCFKLAGFSLWPFGQTVVRTGSSPVLGAIANVLWFIFAGIWIAITYVLAGLLLCITLIGIPFGIQAFKLAGLALTPFGRDVVPAETVDPANRFV